MNIRSASARPGIDESVGGVIVTYDELLSGMAHMMGASKKDAEHAFNAFCTTLERGLSEDGDVSTRIGNFGIRLRHHRNGERELRIKFRGQITLTRRLENRLLNGQEQTTFIKERIENWRNSSDGRIEGDQEAK